MKKRLPRKKKKSILKGGVLVYDIAGLPNGMKMFDVLTAFQDKKIVVWASKAHMNSGQIDLTTAPFVIDNKVNIKFKDLADEK